LRVVVGAVCEHGIETIEAIAPRDLELVEETVDGFHALELAPHELLAAAPVLRDETGVGEDGHVLLHCREAHRIKASQLGHGPITSERLGHDVATSRVCESVEQPVGPVGILGGDLIYNHLVVD
jgi:hypothetical protein